MIKVDQAKEAAVEVRVEMLTRTTTSAGRCQGIVIVIEAETVNEAATTTGTRIEHATMIDSKIEDKTVIQTDLVFQRIVAIKIGGKEQDLTRTYPELACRRIRDRERVCPRI